MKFIVILNEKAGTAASGSDAITPEALREAFSENGVNADVRALPPDQIEAALREAVNARPDAVIVGGGDGSVRSAAALLVDSETPLGVLPLGTLNHFAKDLGIPPAWKDAVSALAGAETRSVDLGEVNGHIFINNCSLGAYADAVRHRDELRERHGHSKWWAMLRATFAAFRRMRRMRLRITMTGATNAVRTPLVVIANNAYSGHVLDKNMRERLDEGRLWIYTAHVHKHLPALRMAWQTIVRRIDAADALQAEPVTELTIEYSNASGGTSAIAADGELVDLKSPLQFKIRPKALRVLIPRKVEPAKIEEDEKRAAAAAEAEAAAAATAAGAASAGGGLGSLAGA